MLLYWFLFAALSVAAQPSKNAERLFNKAMNYRAQNQPEKAFATMHRAIKSDSRYEDAYINLGNWYFHSQRYKEAAEVYQQAAYNCRGGHKAYARPLATALLMDGQLSQAQFVTNKYGGNSKEWQELKQQITVVRRAMNNPHVEQAVNMGIRVNTESSETFPTISADGQTLYYTRRTNGIDDDIYFSKRDSCGGWFSGLPMPYPVNTSGQEAAQMISADKHYLFFMRCDNRSITGWANSSCDLYMAYTADSIWSTPQGFGATINTPSYEGMPCLSSDNRVLYFASDREGGFGGLDIWMSRFESGLWQEPINLGPEINTPGNESAPFLHADNKTLLFVSDGHPGMGKTDIFISRRVSDTSWTPARNVGYPINSTSAEASISLSVDGRKAYFSSNRDRLEADYDLYEMDWPKSLRPEEITFINGRVYDSLSGHALNYASIFLHDLYGNQVQHYTSNRGDGSFMIIMPINTKYTVSIHRFGYKSIIDTLIFSESHLAEPWEFNVALLPDDYKEPLDDTLILTLHFATNYTILSEDQKKQIQDAIAPWLPGNDLLVEVNGYTDNTGTPMVNEQVSKLRAQAVASGLVEAGLNPAAMYSQGWGEVNPVADNETQENRDLNRRVEIIIRR